MALSVVPYLPMFNENESNSTPATAATPIQKNPRYGECLRNHAASIGGHAKDGCGEFMPGGATGTIESVKCAACGCHRNFHRHKEAMALDRQVIIYNASHGWDVPITKNETGFSSVTPHLPHQAFTTVDLRQYRRSETAEGGDDQTARKRFRTKFTQEQKDKMVEFSEKVGWRVQKQDEVALKEFCREVGVKCHVFKVWMHNNKSTIGKKDGVGGSSCTANYLE